MISWLVSVLVFVLCKPEHHGSTPKKCTKILDGIGGGVWKMLPLAYKSYNISELGKIGPRLLLRANR